MNESDESANRAYWRKSFPDVPDMGKLVAHAERYGSDGVYETAESYGYPLPQLLQLDAELTRIDIPGVSASARCRQGSARAPRTRRRRLST